MNRPITNFVLSINHDMFKHGPACFITVKYFKYIYIQHDCESLQDTNNEDK